MAPFRLTIEHGQFRDAHGRQVILRGINVAGDAKLPSAPDCPSHVSENFFDGDRVTFHKRPFSKHEAPMHFARLKRYGFNTIRYVFTWEALEAAGPGIYDEEFVRHTIEILRIAKAYGFYVFMDPHQDVWSRFTGGSGAPMWTVYACGLNPRAFAATEAALVHNTYSDPAQFPKMIWSTNYFRLAAGTIFTLFFAGKDFAPRCVIDGVNIQDYLQKHFINACAHLAKRIHEAGDLEDLVVFGWESLNEPSRGMIGYADLTVIPRDHPLKKGTCPTMWQTLLTGMGRACEVDTWDMGGLGPYKTGTSLVDPQGEMAWLPRDYDDSQYGWRRDPEWRLGECIWAQHGVWDPETDTILRKDYFARNPRTKKTIDYPEFTNTYFIDFWRNFSRACRGHHKDCIMLMQYPTLGLPPQIKGTEDDDPLMAFAPHFYDGITLMTKHWNSTWNVDVVGVLRGRYLHPIFGIRIGEAAIRNCLRDQLASLRQEGIERMGEHPCVLTEFGIPFDMDDKKAYRSGNYSSQLAALDANYFAVEGSLLEGHCLWVYSTNNDHERGDQWNGEDLSIISLDDKTLALSSVPKAARMGSPAAGLSKSSMVKRESGIDEGSVRPDNLCRTLTNASINSGLSTKDPELSNAPGYRAAEAYIRPTATAVAGIVMEAGFDLARCVYRLRLRAAKEARDEAPTTVFLPECHFPSEECEVTVSAGRWSVSLDEDEGPLLQRLRWWHPEGEQELTIRGVVRRQGVGSVPLDEVGYLEQCRQGYGFSMGSCSVM